MSLNNLSNRLGESGQREAALKAIQRAVEIREQLAKWNFATYGPDLASSLNNLSGRLAENGQRELALKAIESAVEIYEQLAKWNFAAYGPDLAMSLNNLSLHVAESGQREAPLEAIERAVEIYEQLAKGNFAAYGPDLAMSFHNLSIHVAESGQREAALEAIERAVEIYEQLAEGNFTTYGPFLGLSLCAFMSHRYRFQEWDEVIGLVSRIGEVITKTDDLRYLNWLNQFTNHIHRYFAELPQKQEFQICFNLGVVAFPIFARLSEQSFEPFGFQLSWILGILSFLTDGKEIGDLPDFKQMLAELKQKVITEQIPIPEEYQFLFQE